MNIENLFTIFNKRYRLKTHLLSEWRNVLPEPKTRDEHPAVQWAKVAPKIEPKKIEIVLSPEYVRANNLGEDCILATLFKKTMMLRKKLFEIAEPNERPELLELFRQEGVYVEIAENSNFVIRSK